MENSEKKKGIAVSKDLCSKNDKIPVSNYIINYCDGTIIYYNNYDTYMRTVKTYYYLNPKCYNNSNFENNKNEPQMGFVLSYKY